MWTLVKDGNFTQVRASIHERDDFEEFDKLIDALTRQRDEVLKNRTVSVQGFERAKLEALNKGTQQ